MSANNHIEIVGNETRLAGQLRGLIDQWIQVTDDMNDVYQAMAQSNGGGTLAADWGFTGTNGADNAGAVMGLLADITNAVNNLAASQQLRSRCK